MGFSEHIKKKVRAKSNFTCCMCRDTRRQIEIHHIIPQAEGGKDDIENAAPLCGGCHADYGNNPDLRKQIRERRDKLYKDNQISRPRLERFENLLEQGDWIRERIYEKEVWMCAGDELYQIIVDYETSEDFTESWTQVFPAKYSSSRYYVNLTIHGVIIKQLYFISCDGGRIFVPMPRIRVEKEVRSFFWDRNSLEYKVGLIINDYYIYEGLERIAEIAKAEISELPVDEF